MTVWKTPETFRQCDFPFRYLSFGPDDVESIDLDDGLLRELVEMFVSIQLDYWDDINQMASFRFPDRSVPPYVDQVERFLQRDQDGFVRLFGEYIPYFIVLRHLHAPDRPCTQKKPHLKPRDHYSDHLAVWKEDENSYHIVLTEVKTTEANARALIRDNVFPEFAEIEAGYRDRDLKAEINALDWYFLKSRAEVRNLVDSLFWKDNLNYQAFVVSTKVGPNLFRGYDDAVAVADEDPGRRWATVVLIANWADWVMKIWSMTQDYLSQVRMEGHL